MVICREQGAKDLHMVQLMSCSRQITMPVPHNSVFYRPDALPATQPTASKHWRQANKRQRRHDRRQPAAGVTTKFSWQMKTLRKLQFHYYDVIMRQTHHWCQWGRWKLLAADWSALSQSPASAPLRKNNKKNHVKTKVLTTQKETRSKLNSRF